ncbi:MAG: IS66 family transposase [Allorhizobium sp.]
MLIQCCRLRAPMVQAHAYGGYNPLFKVDRNPCPLTLALCWAHSRRQFFMLADIAANAKRGKNAVPISPMALEAVKRIDDLFDIERDIKLLAAGNVWSAAAETACRSSSNCTPGVKPSGQSYHASAPVAEAIDYMLMRWDGLTSFLHDGRICLTNNAGAQRLRTRQKSWPFAGSDRGADRTAFMATLIMTAKLNNVHPQAWLLISNLTPTLMLSFSNATIAVSTPF